MPSNDLKKAAQRAAAVPSVRGAVPASSVPANPSIEELLDPTVESGREVTQHETIEDSFGYPVAYRMAFIGAGQAGGRIAENFWKLGYRRVCLFNTSNLDFSLLDPNIRRLELGVGGAAKDMDFAALHFRRNHDGVRDLLTRSWGNSVDYAMVCVGLGGGSGCGATPGLVSLIREHAESTGMHTKVGAVVSLPLASEGQRVCRNAVTTFVELLKLKVSPLVIIDNARINQLYKPSLADLYPRANTTASYLFHQFNKFAAIDGTYYTFDTTEYAQLLDSGILVMGAVTFKPEAWKSPADVSGPLRDRLNNNVLAQVDLGTGTVGVCMFRVSQEAVSGFSVDFFEAGFSQLGRMLDQRKNSVAHRGLYVDGEALQAYVAVAGVAAPAARLQELSGRGDLDHPVPGLGDFLRV